MALMFTIRDYAPADFDDLLALDQLCFTEGIAYTHDALAYFLSRRGSVKLVAERDRAAGGIGGFLVGSIERNQTAHIITIDIRPECRRSGLGSDLMREAEQRFEAA